MHDMVISRRHDPRRHGRPPFTGDVAIDGERIVAVGGKAGPARRVIDADGLLVTPGWVDVHTHYDGQATWDPVLAPSSWHGVTTILFGNCGVGFAPVRPEHRDGLIDLMEAIEDIPGTAPRRGSRLGVGELSGIPRRARAPCRARSMSRRRSRTIRCASMSWASAASIARPATPEDIAAMRRLTEEALRAGAFGFTTSRTYSHKTNAGELVPGRFAEEAELFGIGRALGDAGRGAFGMNSDFDDEAAEFAWMTRLSKETGRPVWFLLTDRVEDPERWRRLMGGVHAARAAGAQITAQVAGRPVGVIMGVARSFNPFSIRPSYPDSTSLPAAERLARLRDPAVRRADARRKPPSERQMARLSQSRGTP